MNKDLEVLKSLGYRLGDTVFDTRTGNYYLIADVNGNIVLKGAGTENRYPLTMLMANRDRFRKA